MSKNHLTIKITEEDAQTHSRNKDIHIKSAKITNYHCPICGEGIYENVDRQTREHRYRCFKCAIRFSEIAMQKIVNKQALREKWIRLQND